MKHILLFVLCSIGHDCLTAIQLDQYWIRSFDSLSGYQVMRSDSAASDMQCTALASRLNLPGMQLVAFNSATRACTMYKCAPSLPDCRKCRDFNSGNQQVWIPGNNIGSCWSTVQHRVSPSVDFYRPWADYKAGFGEGPSGNFWIGLSTLNSLTSVSGGRKLRLMMKAWNGSESWAQYSSFSVGPESDGFRLSVSGFSSSHSAIGDSFSLMNGSKFSTNDQDNDGVTSNVAHDFHGAWWFNAVSRCHGNGLYQILPTALNTPYGQGLMWLDPYGSYYSLMEFEMLLLL